jgi:hypothetical protein
MGPRTKLVMLIAAAAFEAPAHALAAAAFQAPKPLVQPLRTVSVAPWRSSASGAILSMCSPGEEEQRGVRPWWEAVFPFPGSQEERRKADVARRRRREGRQSPGLSSPVCAWPLCLRVHVVFVAPA